MSMGEEKLRVTVAYFRPLRYRMMSVKEILGTGHVGGKAAGFFKARAILASDKMRVAFPDLAQHIRFPETWVLTTDHFHAYVTRNQLGAVLADCEAMKKGADEACRAAFHTGTFSPETLASLREVLAHAAWPLAVRSSSLLEDRPGTSFAGKYLTLFISNRGSDDERLQQLCTAIQSVYASVGNPNAIHYRRRHRLLKAGEQMAIMIQHAIGREYQGCYLPIVAGVGFSQNPHCWHPEIKKGDGLIRLVFGLGTRAVGRGYARIFSPGNPTSRAEGTMADTIEKFSQGMIDVLDLATNTHRSLHFREIVRSGFDCYPGAEKLFSLRDGTTLYTPATRMWNPEHRPLLTFDAILTQPWADVQLPRLFKQMLQVLEAEFGIPVDTEFAGDLVDDRFTLYLLQARALTQREEQNPRALPKVPAEDIFFTANREVPTGYVEEIEYVVYVDPDAYFACARNQRHTVARYVGEINRALEGKRFILMGPGRWGSVNIDLGVPCKYAELSNAAILVEIAKGAYAPEASYGTHFFQDLIEDQILYMPLYLGESGVIFREELMRSNNQFQQLFTADFDAAFADIIRVIHLPAVTGKKAIAVLNGIEEKGIVYLK